MSQAPGKVDFSARSAVSVARTAFATHTCGRLTSRLTARQSMACAKGEGALADGLPTIAICIPSCRRSSKLSRKRVTVGRGLAFAPGDVQTRIRPVTGRHSLFPTSQARTAVQRPLRRPHSPLPGCPALKAPGNAEGTAAVEEELELRGPAVQLSGVQECRHGNGGIFWRSW